MSGTPGTPGTPGAAGVSPELLAIIVCPDCHGQLSVTERPGAEPELVCEGCGLAYPVRDGIPVLLVDEARRPPA